MFLVLAKKTSQLKAKRRKLLSTSTKGGGTENLSRNEAAIVARVLY